MTKHQAIQKLIRELRSEQEQDPGEPDPESMKIVKRVFDAGMSRAISIAVNHDANPIAVQMMREDLSAN